MRAIIIGFISISALVTLLFDASNAADKTPAEIVREARSAIKEVSIVEVKRIVDAKEPVILVDVRDREEFETGYIPGAMNISRGTLEFKIGLLIPDKNANIIVYCGLDLRSAPATRTLNDLGYRNAVNMSGGLKAWKEAGYPLQNASK
ncbi:MAG TPA: rhodanese-like domain-containing protein [Dissulfurispiraceae bacterium]|nr:rhodanese-like domain-containing protein [Dissulfurispiraceae bacterium]